MKEKVAVSTAAFSQLGRMMIRLSKDAGITLINVVRKDEQVKILKEEYGQKYVLNLTKPDFKEEYTNLCKKLKVKVVFECIAGDFTGELMSMMPPKSTCLFYGSLRDEPIKSLDPLTLMVREHKVVGWVLGDWL